MPSLPSPQTNVYLYGMTVWSTIHRLGGDYPQADGYGEIEETHQVPGGEAGNSAIVLSRWGHRVKISGPFLGTETRAGVTTFLQSKAIDCSAFDYDDSFEGVRDMILVGGKTRTVFGRFGHYFGAATKRWSKPAATDIAGADIVGLDPYFADESIEVARLSVELGKPYVTIDCPVESYLHRHSAATVVSAEYLRNQFPGRDPRQLLRDYADAGRGLTIFTFGAEEILFARNGGAIQSVRPHLIVPKCTLGAGDTFRGGVMHAVFSGMADEDVVRFAAATAACVCLRFPMAFDPPGLDEITAMAARIGR